MYAVNNEVNTKPATAAMCAARVAANTVACRIQVHADYKLCSPNAVTCLHFSRLGFLADVASPLLKQLNSCYL